jgi:hypothetical protein
MSQIRLPHLVPGILVTVSACGGGDGIAPPPPPPPLGVVTIELTAPAGVLAAGVTMQLTAVARNAAGAVIAAVPFTWQTSAAQTATVSGQGVVRGVSAGTATITASAEGRNGTVQVAVRDTSSLPATLNGLIERVDLTIAANQTYTVSGNTAIVVDSTFILAGTLEVAKGASLTLYGGKRLEISGILDGDSAAEYIIGGGEVEIDDDQQAALRGDRSASAKVSGLVGGAEATYLSPKSLTVKQGGHITSGKGEDGTKESRDGKKGYNIEIGTILARTKMTGTTGKVLPATESIVVENGGRILAGNGGKGYSVAARSDGVVTGNLWTARAGNGGPGGDVVLAAGQIDVQRVINGGTWIMGGRGGNGGSIQPAEPLRDGSGLAEEGESLDAFSGGGGNGGQVIINAPQFAAAPLAIWRAGGGEVGEVSVSGGNGRNGGPGGNFILVMGTPGDHGTVTAPPGTVLQADPAPNPPRIFLKEAINGGHSADPQKPGGRGGLLAVSGPSEAVTAVQSINLNAVARGGFGFNGCAVNPVINGTGGGDGGKRSLLLVGAPPIQMAGSSFDGGPGGPGFPAAGAGGARGEQLQGPGGAIPLGNSGIPGALCPTGTPGERKVAIANFSSGLTIAEANGTAVTSVSTTPTPLGGAVVVQQLESDPTKLIIGTTTAPGLVSATLSEDGQVTMGPTRSTSAPVFRMESSGACTQVVQPDQLQSFDPALNLAGQASVPGITGLAVHGDRVFTHTGAEIAFYNLNPSTCSLAPSGLPPFPVPDLRSVAVHPGGNLIVELQQSLFGGGGSRLLFQGLDANGFPSIAMGQVNLPGRAFGLGFNPEGTRLYVLGDLGVVSVISVDPGAPAFSGTFHLLGADQLEVLPDFLLYRDVSDPNLGRICSRSLGADGFPSGPPVCEQNSTRPRPDSFFTMLSCFGDCEQNVRAARPAVRAPR